MRTKLFLEYLKGRHNSEDLDIDVKIILKLILGKLDVRMWTRFIWHRTVPARPVVDSRDSREHGNELLSGSIKG